MIITILLTVFKCFSKAMPSTKLFSQQHRESGGGISTLQVRPSFIHSLAPSPSREHLLSLFYVLGPVLVPQRVYHLLQLTITKSHTFILLTWNWWRRGWSLNQRGNAVHYCQKKKRKGLSFYFQRKSCGERMGWWVCEDKRRACRGGEKPWLSASSFFSSAPSLGAALALHANLYRAVLVKHLLVCLQQTVNCSQTPNRHKIS